MSFAGRSHPKPAKSRRQHAHGLHFAASITIDEHARVKRQAKERGVPALVFSSAAIFWFASLSREEQVRRIDAVRRRGKERLSILLRPEAVDECVSWNFPLFFQYTVIGAAIIGFSALSPAEHETWIMDLAMGQVGAPRPVLRLAQSAVA